MCQNKIDKRYSVNPILFSESRSIRQKRGALRHFEKKHWGKPKAQSRSLAFAISKSNKSANDKLGPGNCKTCIMSYK